MHGIGLHLDPPWFHVAYAKRKGDRIELLDKQSFLTDTLDVKRLYIPRRSRLATGLSSRDFLLKKGGLPSPGTKYVDELLAFQAEAQTEFNSEQAISLFFYQNGEPHFVIAPYETLQTHLATYHHLFRASSRRGSGGEGETGKTGASTTGLSDPLPIDPDIISAVAQGQSLFAQWKFPTLKDAFLIDLGRAETTCTWMKNRALQKTWAFPMGIEKALHAFWEDRKKVLLHKEVEGAARQVDLLQLKKELNPHLHSALQELAQQIGKALSAFARHTEPLPLLFTGKMDAFSHLREFLYAHVGTLGEGDFPIKADEAKYAVAIGLALEAVAPKGPLLQFRKGPFYPRKGWRAIGRNAIFLTAASCGLCGAGAIWAGWSASTQTQKLRENLSLILEQTDPELLALAQKEGLSLGKLVDQWEATLSSAPSPSPFAKTPPPLSPLLQWIFSHPLFTSGELTLSSLRYRLTSTPQLSAPDLPLAAKVELSVISPHHQPAAARKLYEELLLPAPFIDPEKGVEWQTAQDSYTLSFYLGGADAP